MTDTSTAPALLAALQSGDRAALDGLFPLIYEALRDLAHRQRLRWHGDLTLNTTALVHEAYLRLSDQAGWESRAHFFGVAARAMRHILIDYARRRQARKRGGDVQTVSLPPDDLAGLVHVAPGRFDEVVALGSALDRLAEESPREARVVECRFFGAMTIPETAVALGISPMTVKRDWAMARAWLYRELIRMGVELPA